jgi:hypothetical protein
MQGQPRYHHDLHISYHKNVLRECKRCRYLSVLGILLWWGFEGSEAEALFSENEERQPVVHKASEENVTILSIGVSRV